MTELDKLVRARMYLDKLANGIDPRTEQELPDDTVLNDVRLARCFFYAADVLRRVIENGGEVQSPKKAKKSGFTLTSEQLAGIQVSATPISISDMVEKINSLIDTEGMKKLTTTTITNWLLDKGFLQEIEKEGGKKSRRPTQQGESIGLSTEERITVRGSFTVVLYNSDAQAFILDHLATIVEEVQTK